MTDNPTPSSADARAALAEFERWAEGSESDGRSVVWRVLRQDGDAYDVIGEYASRSLRDKTLSEERMKATLSAATAQSPSSADVIEHAMQQAADIARQKGVEFEALYPRLAQGCELAAQAICKHVPAADVIEGMREALRPFAELLDQFHESAKSRWSLEKMVLVGDMHLGNLTIGDLRKAKAALALPDSKPDQGGA